MLMPGATVCEVCGEVIIPTHPNKITATLPLTYNDEEEKPGAAGLCRAGSDTQCVAAGAKSGAA